MSESPDSMSPSTQSIRGFFNLANAWALTPVEQRTLLGGLPESTLHQWHLENDGVLTVDQLERISQLLAIQRCLQALLSTGTNEWVRQPNSNLLFGGRPALEMMLAGGTRSLQQVRVFLEAQCGGWA